MAGCRRSAHAEGKMEVAAPVLIRKRALETLSIIKNKMRLGDWVKGEKMLCKCEGGGEAAPRGQGGPSHFRAR